MLRPPGAVGARRRDHVVPGRGAHRHGPVEVLVRVGLGHQGGEHPLPSAVGGHIRGRL
ncbi:hypothetical protein SUDANB43_07362 [Streptomyces sp. enrichment culture]